MNDVQDTFSAGRKLDVTANPPGAAALDRRNRLRGALIESAERIIAEQGLRGLKARSLAAACGCAVGAIYNVFADLDALVLDVNARTLGRLESRLRGALGSLPGPGETGAEAEIAALAGAYLDFALDEPQAWRAVFEHKMAEGGTVPDWYRVLQARLFSYLDGPLKNLMGSQDEIAIAREARIAFSALHGLVVLGLDEKLVPTSADALGEDVRAFVRTLCRGYRP